jgi:hypothetical protein
VTVREKSWERRSARDKGDRRIMESKREKRSGYPHYHTLNSCSKRIILFW